MEVLYNENVVLKENIDMLLNENNQLKAEIEKLKQYKKKVVERSSTTLQKLKHENPEKLKEYWRTANANRIAKQQVIKNI